MNLGKSVAECLGSLIFSHMPLTAVDSFVSGSNCSLRKVVVLVGMPGHT